jgi:hypothetical protein
MPTECSTLSLDFGTVEGRRVEAAFDAGLVTYEAGPWSAPRDADHP